MTDIEFLQSWGLTEEENQKRLEMVNNGQLVQIRVGCDTGITRVMNCEEIHGKYIKHSLSGWIATCRVCDKAFKNKNIETVLVYVNDDRISEFVDAKLLEEELILAERQVDLETEQETKKKEQKTNERKAEQGNRTVVNVIRNAETGLWRIVGGENGRLDRPVFFQALGEMRDSFKLVTNEFLASAPQPEKHEQKHFDLLTKNFAYKIIDEVFEE
jgi:hypothetical protein